jgi:hypothetical protein
MTFHHNAVRHRLCSGRPATAVVALPTMANVSASAKPEVLVAALVTSSVVAHTTATVGGHPARPVQTQLSAERAYPHR